MWITTVVYRAPRMYFDFYYLDKGSVLPPRRQACLLREGIEEAKKQQIRIKNEIIEIENNIKPIKSTSNSNTNSANDGADCGNKVKGNLDKQIKRNTQVELICGVDDEIIEINEIELCVYNMLVSSPIACTFDLQEQSIAQLEALQVLGFTRLKKPNITLNEIDISPL
eukprot:gene19777-25715_t